MLAVLIGSGALALDACLSVQPIPSPAPPPAPPSPTPTFVFPTLPPTSTPTPAPSPSPTPDVRAGFGAVLYSGAMAQGPAWTQGEDSNGGTSLVDGRLVLAVRRPNALRYALVPVVAQSDFYLEVTVSADVCTGDDEFGVMFRVNPDAEHYRFTITCAGGVHLVRALQDSGFSLLPVADSHAVIPGTEVSNRLGVWASGSSFRFFVNGLQVFETRDPVLPGGGFGLCARSGKSGQTTVAFSDLEIWSLLPTPTPTRRAP